MKKLCLISLVIVLLVSLILISCGPVSAPTAPTGLTCNAVSSSQINLSWSASSGATGYRIYRCTGTTCTPINLVHTGSSTSWSDTGLTPDTIYRYRVKAYNANGESNYSSTVSCTTHGISPPPEDYGLVMGKVTDTAGNPLGDVTITVGGESGVTNEQGWFSISNVAAGDRVLVKFSKSGYATAYQVTKVRIGAASWLEVPMGAVDVSQSIDATSGGNITTPDGGMLDIGANSLVDSQGNNFTGTAVVSLTVFDPSDETERNAFPGGEYGGISAQDEIVPIESYGFMDILVNDGAGGEVQVAPGKNATIRIPVPDDMQAVAESMGTCPLWYFDTETGYWREEGQATYHSASGCFEGTISHFSVWNGDVPRERAFIRGRVVDSFGNPVQFARVTAWGRKPNGGAWNSGETSTPAAGTFPADGIYGVSGIPVAAGVVFYVQASKGGQKGPVYTFGPFPKSDTPIDVGDILLDPPLIQTTLTWGQNPSDLDSHLAANIDGTFHVWYGDMGSLTSEPYAKLDTDDTSSYGPETISITKLFPGKYRYSVRHYYGTGNIGTSGAAVNVVIDGVGILSFTPPAGQPAGTDIWRIIDMVVDVNGNLIAVNLINDYVTGDDTSELLFP